MFTQEHRPVNWQGYSQEELKRIRNGLLARDRAFVAAINILPPLPSQEVADAVLSHSQLNWREQYTNKKCYVKPRVRSGGV